MARTRGVEDAAIRSLLISMGSHLDTWRYYT
jgi:hypothetical protein